MAQARLSRLELTRPDSRLCLIRRAGNTAGLSVGGASPGQSAQEPAAGPKTVVSPEDVVTTWAAGVFLTQHPLRAAPLAQSGQRVSRGDVVALLCIDALYLPVTAPRDGVIGELLAGPGDLVGYGTALFRLSNAS